MGDAFFVPFILYCFEKEQLHEVNKRNLINNRGFLCFFNFTHPRWVAFKCTATVKCFFFPYGIRSLYLFTQVRGKLNNLSLPYNNSVFLLFSYKNCMFTVTLLSRPYIFQCNLCKQNNHTERCETKTLSDH